MDQQLAISKARWDQTVEASLNRLGNKRHLVRMDLDSATIDLRLKALLSRTEKSGLGTAISSFQQFASLLQQFTTAINAMAQTDRTVSFVWGAVLAVLEVRHPCLPLFIVLSRLSAIVSRRRLGIR